jgi:hypothetical protein
MRKHRPRDVRARIAAQDGDPLAASPVEHAAIDREGNDGPALMTTLRFHVDNFTWFDLA